MVSCWGRMRLIFRPHVIWFVCSHFPSRLLLLARIFLFFNWIFLRTFIIVTRFSLTTIIYFVISITNFPLFNTCAYIFVGNVHSIKRNIVQIQVIFSSIIKTPYVFVKGIEQFWTTCVLRYSIPNIFKYLVLCCVHMFVRQLKDVFATLINVKKTVSYIHGFFIFLIRSNWSLFLAPIIILTWSLFLTVNFMIVRTCFLGTFLFLCNSIIIASLTCFLLDNLDLFIYSHSIACFLFLSSWETRKQ